MSCWFHWSTIRWGSFVCLIGGLTDQSCDFSVYAPAETKVDFGGIKGDALGIVPHQIRGFLSHFSNSLITGFSYDRCTACSRQVVEAYIQDGFEFIQKVCNQPKVLEEISGLSKAIQEMEESFLDWEPFDDDDE